MDEISTTDVSSDLAICHQSTMESFDLYTPSPFGPTHPHLHLHTHDYLKLMIYGLESASRRYDEARRSHAPGRERKRTGTQPKDCSLIASPLACEYSPRVVVCVV